MSAESQRNAVDSVEARKKPRLCHVVKREDFDGYGFNLHAEKGKPGQYIGKVDENSPAEMAGLRQGDRIIEVNDVNIGTETHKQVVQRIKANPNEVGPSDYFLFSTRLPVQKTDGKIGLVYISCDSFIGNSVCDSALKCNGCRFS